MSTPCDNSLPHQLPEAPSSTTGDVGKHNLQSQHVNQQQLQQQGAIIMMKDLNPENNNNTVNVFTNQQVNSNNNNNTHASADEAFISVVRRESSLTSRQTAGNATTPNNTNNIGIPHNKKRRSSHRNISPSNTNNNSVFTGSTKNNSGAGPGDVSNSNNHNNSIHNNNTQEVSTTHQLQIFETYKVGEIVFPPPSLDAIKPFYPAREVDWVHASLEKSSIFGFTDPQVQAEYLQFLYRDVMTAFMSLVYWSGGAFLAGTNVLNYGPHTSQNFVTGGIMCVCAVYELFIHFCMPLQSNFAVQARRVCSILAMLNAALLCGPLVYFVFLHCDVQVDYLKSFGIDPGRADMPAKGSPEYIKNCVNVVLSYTALVSALTIPHGRIQLPYMWALLVVHYIMWELAYAIWGREQISDRAMAAQVLLSLVVLAFSLGFTYFQEQLRQDQFVETARLEKNLRLASNAAEQVDKLLCSMLPPSVLSRVLLGEPIRDMTFAGTVFSSDMKSYTEWSSSKSAAQVVELLNELCISSDRLAQEIGVEKITTIGDAYIAEAGLPRYVPDHAARVIRFALLYQENVIRVSKMKREWNGIQFRVGIHTGAFNGTILGAQMRYTVFGETCEISEQIEKNGVPGKVIVSATTAAFLNKYYLMQQGKLDPTSIISINPWYLNNNNTKKDVDDHAQQQQQQQQQQQAFIELSPDSVLNVSTSRRGGVHQHHDPTQQHHPNNNNSSTNPPSSRSSSRTSNNSTNPIKTFTSSETTSNNNNNVISQVELATIQEIFSSIEIVDSRLLLYEVEFADAASAYSNYYENFVLTNNNNQQEHQHDNKSNRTSRAGGFGGRRRGADSMSLGANSVATSNYRNNNNLQHQQQNKYQQITNNNNNNNVDQKNLLLIQQQQQQQQRATAAYNEEQKEKRRKFIQQKMKDKIKAEEERKKKLAANNKNKAKKSIINDPNSMMMMKHEGTDFTNNVGESSMKEKPEISANDEENLQSSIITASSTIPEIEAFYSARKWNWIFLDFANCEDEYKEFARKKMRTVVLWCRAFILVTAVFVMITVGIEQKDFGTAAAILLPVSVVGAIVVCLATYFYSQQFETAIALLSFAVVSLVCIGTALVPESMASNDAAWIVMYFACVVSDGMTSIAALWRCLIFLLILEVPVLAIQFRVTMTPANIVFFTAASVLIFAVVALSEKVLRRQFIEHIVALEYSKKTIESGAEQRALLETSLPAHVIPELMEWMENDMAPEKSVAREDRISICFAKLIPRRAPLHSVSSLSEEIKRQQQMVGDNNNNAMNSSSTSIPSTGGIVASSSSSQQQQQQQNQQQQQQQQMIREIFSEHAAWLAESHNEVDQMMNTLRQQHLEAGSTPFSIIKIKIIGDILMLAGNCGGGSSSSNNNNNNNLNNNYNSITIPNNTHNESFSPSSRDGSSIIKNSLSTSCFDMMELVEKLTNASNNFTVKCGMHVGDVVSAVIGEEKISYDTFGDTVNVASRILSSVIAPPKKKEQVQEKQQQHNGTSPTTNTLCGEIEQQPQEHQHENNDNEFTNLVFAAASEDFCNELGLYQPEENSSVVSYTLGNLRVVEAKGKGAVQVRTVNV